MYSQEQGNPKRYLLCGASSAIAKSLISENNKFGHHYIGISTVSDLDPAGFTSLYQVTEYTAVHLPDIDGPLDGLVYFPGTIHLKPFNRFTEDDFLSDLRINVIGATSCIRKYHSNLRMNSSSSVVLFSSVAASLGMAYHSSIAMAKGAVEGLTRSLAAEFAPRIRVNAIAPSLSDTPLGAQFLNTPEKREAAEKRNPLNRIGRPSEIASVVDFLLSENSSWMTGQILSVDGGMKHLRII